MIEYRTLELPQLEEGMLSSFDRRQEVRECWRRIAGAWTLVPQPFTEDWTSEDKAKVVEYLRETRKKGGAVIAARENGQLVGFASVERALFGSRNQYAHLTSIHVSRDHRGMGVGRGMFHLAMDIARGFGAKKMYMSTHSSKETQAFYQAMGCVDAEEQNAHAVEREPFDRQLEVQL
ncbi:MAG: GNAT family N-acetyltransferase [Eubacteriales bacterium]|nr:GNAT family N-acetyltransferase [Eubacteriales bacterium]